MLFKAGIFIFLLLLPGKDGLLQDLKLFSKSKKDAPLTPQLVKVKALTQPESNYEAQIMERRLGLVVFELENDTDCIFTNYLVSSFSRGNRFRLLYLQKIPFFPPPSALTISVFPLEKMPLIALPPEVVSLPEMARHISADLAVMGRIVVGKEEKRIQLWLVDLLSERILLAETIQGDEDEILREIDAFIEKIYDLYPLLEGEVIFVRANRINLDLGRFDGVREGMEFLLYRVLGLERLGNGGLITGIKTQDLGLARVLQVSEFTSEAEIIELLPLCQIQRGDKVVTR